MQTRDDKFSAVIYSGCSTAMQRQAIVVRGFLGSTSGKPTELLPTGKDTLSLSLSKSRQKEKQESCADEKKTQVRQKREQNTTKHLVRRANNTDCFQLNDPALAEGLPSP